MDNEFILRWLSFYGKDWVEFQQIVIDGFLDYASWDEFDRWLNRGFISRLYPQDSYSLTNKALQQLTDTEKEK